jgi:hypothetical protein
MPIQFSGHLKPFQWDYWRTTGWSRNWSVQWSVRPILPSWGGIITYADMNGVQRGGGVVLRSLLIENSTDPGQDMSSIGASPPSDDWNQDSPIRYVLTIWNPTPLELDFEAVYTYTNFQTMPYQEVILNEHVVTLATGASHKVTWNLGKSPGVATFCAVAWPEYNTRAGLATLDLLGGASFECSVPTATLESDMTMTYNFVVTNKGTWQGRYRLMASVTRSVSTPNSFNLWRASEGHVWNAGSPAQPNIRT